jgi:hypothetical protein
LSRARAYIELAELIKALKDHMIVFLPSRLIAGLFVPKKAASTQLGLYLNVGSRRAPRGIDILDSEEPLTPICSGI